MLQIDKVQQIVGVTVFGDGDPARFHVFYPLPNQPRYRVLDNGRFSFGFFKYRYPIDRPDGKRGGGFLLFDIEFVVEEAKLAQIRQQLQQQVDAEANRRGISPAPQVEFGAFTFTKGTSSLLYPEAMVERQVPSGGAPSLFGNNVSTFALELSPEGATFFEQAMQGSGGAVSVVYDMWYWAKLPPVKIRAYWNASKFYSFYQTIDTDWNLWAEDSYRETVREQMIQSESMSLDFEWGGVTDPKVQAELRDWAARSLEDAVERNMIAAIAPLSEDQRKAPDGIEDVTRDITSTQISSVSINYKESQTVEWHVAPQGILPNITQLTDGNGAAVVWSDYARTIDLNDPFFKQLRINAYVNADFANLPIHSVEVKLIYGGRPMANLIEGEPEGEVVLNDPGDVGKFGAYVENDNWKYKYSYQINYKGESRIYQSPEIETNEGNLTIGVDDVGILAVDVSAGDLNWNELDRVEVVLTYEDSANDVDLIEERFQLTQASPNARVEQVIFQPLRNNYKYKAKYFMKGGREYQGPEFEGRSDRLFINDVFDARKTISVRGVGDFVNRIQTIFVDLEYVDEAHDYRQVRSQALTGASPFFEWTIPVIDEKAGITRYKAMVSNKDGTTQTIAMQTATSDTIILPPATAAFLDVQVVTDLLAWDQLRLARVSLSYADPDNNVFQNKDFIFSPANKANTNWRVELKDRARNQYSYAITYYLASGQQRTIPITATRDAALILDLAA